MNDEPQFLSGTFLWDEDGYQYSSVPRIDLLDPHMLAHQNKWIGLASALEHAKMGNHEQVINLLVGLENEKSAGVLSGRLCLLGDAGPLDAVVGLSNFMKVAEAPFVLGEASRAAMNSGYLWMAPYMLDVWQRIVPSERTSVSLHL